MRIRILLFSSITFKTPTKNNLKKSFSAYYFLKVHSHHFSKIKSPKEVTKQQESRFFFLFLLFDDRRMIEGSGSGSIPLIMDPDPGGPKTCGWGGSGFGSGTQPKIFRVQMRLRKRKTDSNLDICSGELPPGIVHEDFPHCISYLRRVVAATHEPYKPKDITPNSRSDIISQH